MRVLIVEDDVRLQDSVAELLREAGYAVDVTADGVEGLWYGEEFPIDLAIVDLGLPGMSGLELIRALRKASVKVPILILTARTDWQDKVEGLEAGADDYLTKPFHPEELKARVAALLRRAAGHAQPEIGFGPLRIDLSAQRVFLDGTEAELTTFEYKVLEYLAMRAGQVVTKAQLAEHIYEEDADRDSNVIEVFIGRLRRKLDPDGVLRPIDTLRGRGYRLDGERLERGT
jgi:two-component system response regulator PhoP